MKFSDFSLAEFRERYRRLQGALKKANIEALVVTQPDNCRYFAGTLTQGWVVKSYQFPSILPANSDLDPVTIIGWGDEVVAETSWIQNIKHFSWTDGWNTGLAVAKSIADVLKDLGLSKGIIGLELSEDMRINFSFPAINELYKQMPEATFVDAGKAIWEVRSVKSPAEIERLRKASAISIQALRQVFERLRPGMTEREITNMMAINMFELGADEIRFSTFYGSPDRAMWADSVPSTYKIESPGRIQYDGGCVYQGYYADFKRMAVIGNISAEDEYDYEVIRSAHAACLDTMQAGNLFEDIFKAAMKSISDSGYSKYTDWCRKNNFTSVGHGIGMDVHEEPLLALGRKNQIVANMVLNIEPLLTARGTIPYWDAKARFGIEDTVLITENGPELLTSTEVLNWDLWRV